MLILNILYRSYFYSLTINIQYGNQPYQNISFFQDIDQNQSEQQTNPSQKNIYYIKKMGSSQSGALNTSGFTHAVKNNQLPVYTHITHSGAYNEQFFQVGKKANELLQLHYGAGVSNCDIYGLSKRNFFISLFLKSQKDGLPRTRNINACICLDISGSMNSQINFIKHCQKTRLMLARDAIFMFFQKLNQNDIFSLVVFHNTARTIIQSNYVSKMDKEKVRSAIYQQFQSGGTTIRHGFDESLKQINKFRTDITNYQNRIIMLTDVCDNSVADQQVLIEEISNSNVGTTIIGVSSDFRSQTCQKLKEVKGFNYFCAVQNDDLKTYLSDRFDYTFFPCVKNVQIKIFSQNISDIRVFGTPDQQKTYKKEGSTFTVTKMPSVFPSELIENKVKKDEIQSSGGLILVKFTPKNVNQLPQIDLKVDLTYQDVDGKKYNKQYVIKQKIEAEQFYSDSAVRKGVSLFYYAESMRNLLKIMNDSFNIQHIDLYISNLNKVGEYCPQSKKEQLNKVIQIVKSKSPPKQATQGIVLK